MSRTTGSSSQRICRDPDRDSAIGRAPAVARLGGLAATWVPLADLAAHPEPWRELAERALEPNVFLEPAFARAALAHLGHGGMGAVAVDAGKRLVGLLPGRIEGLAEGRPVRTFVAWTHPFAPLSTPLVDRDAAPDVVGAMLDFLPHVAGSRLALFPLLAEQGKVAQLMATHLAEGSQQARAFGAHFRAALMPGRDGQVLIGSAKKRKELRRQRRRLTEDGALVHESVVAPEAMRPAIADYLDVEAASWKGRSGGAVKHDPAASRFLAEAVLGLATERKVRIDFLKFKGKVIAATITFFSGDHAWFWKTGYDEAFARYSPGVQLALDLTESLEADRALALVDSCAVADHPMIDHLWSERLAIADWLIPLGGPASLAAGMAAEQARRLVVDGAKALRAKLARR